MLFWQTFKMNLPKKPTLKSLNETLLKFTQGTGIHEKSMRISKEYDGSQELKLVWKDVMEVVKSTLKNKKFKDNLHFESCTER